MGKEQSHVEAAINPSGVISSTADVLRKARALIEKPADWCRHAEARDLIGVPVSPWGKRATRWCMVGATRAVTFNVPGPRFVNAVQVLEEALGTPNIGHFNDHHTHSEVLAAFDRAIELAEREA